MALDDQAARRVRRWVALGLAAGALVWAVVYTALELRRPPGPSPPAAAPEPRVAHSSGEGAEDPGAGATTPLGRSDDTSAGRARPVAKEVAEEASALPERRRREEPVEVSRDITPPRRTAGERPDLSKCRGRGPTPRGGAILRGVVETDGRLDRLEFLKPGPGGCIEQALLDALATWRFRPARRHGEPVVVYYNLTVSIRYQ